MPSAGLDAGRVGLVRVKVTEAGGRAQGADPAPCRHPRRASGLGLPCRRLHRAALLSPCRYRRVSVPRARPPPGSRGPPGHGVLTLLRMPVVRTLNESTRERMNERKDGEPLLRPAAPPRLPPRGEHLAPARAHPADPAEQRRCRGRAPRCHARPTRPAARGRRVFRKARSPEA